jgi:hypothetical protein
MSARDIETTGTVQSTECADRVLELEAAIAAALERLAPYTRDNWDSRFIHEAERILRRALGDHLP